ncbi:metal transporter [Flavobacterium amniphilum]|uniref:heavy-metal-associated domain-containing protein n=1 Tax=Flavobacterium amniphilum TaxID=1834035 RepID=UPI00202A24C4|nr:metal transporter [Flavobacterium amniphilum]MCL9804684.1 metal transporter [Flavobacterium amniphilum]
MKNIVLLLMLMIGFTGMAQGNKNKNAKYNVEVNGNCEMCKKRIEKAAFSVAGVKSAVWNTEDTTLRLILNEEKCSVGDVEKAVAKVGHDTKNVKASEADYNKLHTCCQYERIK